MTKKYLILTVFATLLSALSIKAQTTITLSPSKDAALGYNDGFADGSANYGTAVQFASFKIPSTDQSGYNENRGVMQFNLASIPQGAVITSAKLNLYAFTTGLTVGHIGTNNQCYLQRITQSWTENGVTWLNQPASDTTNRVFLPASTSPIQDYLNIDILGLVNDMIALGNNGFMIKIAIDDTSRGLAFCSSNNTNPLKRPTLEVTYLDPLTPGCATEGPLADVALGHHDGFNLGDDNYGDAVQISAFKIVSTDSSGVNENSGAIKFDLSTIPALATITSAKLNLHAYTTGLTGGHIGTNNQCYLQRITENWTENGATWNNQPLSVTYNRVLLPASDSTNQDYLNIDVAALINDMRLYGNNGLMLTLANDSVGNGLMFCSSDNADSTKRPTIEICWSYSCNAAFDSSIDTASAIVSFSSTPGGNHSWQVNNSNYTTANATYQATPGETLIVTHTVAVPNTCSDTYTDTIVVPVPAYVPSCNTAGPSSDAAIGFNDGFNTGDGNYGNSEHTSAFKLVSTDSSGYNVNSGLIKFDLSNVPALATLNSAKLNLYAYTDGVTNGHFGTINQCYLQRVTQNWGENTVTWNNQPSSSATNQVLLPASDSANQDYFNIDVLALVNDMIANGNNGFLLKLVNDSLGNGLTFCSSNNADSTKRPTLELCWGYSCNAAFNTIVDTTNYTVSLQPASGGVHTWSVNGTQFTTPSPLYYGNPGDTLVINHTNTLVFNCADAASDTIILPTPACNNAFTYNLLGLTPTANESVELVGAMNYGVHHWIIDGVASTDTTPTISVAVTYGDTIVVEHYVSFGTYVCGASNTDTIQYPQPTTAFFQSHVTANTLPRDVIAYLLRMDYVNNQITVERAFSTEPGTGWFLADSLADGDYILKATNTGSPYVLPSYHLSSVFWGDADIFTINGPGHYPDKDIQLIVSISNPGGTGFISGIVDWADTLLRNTGNFEGTTVYIKNANGDIVAYAIADADNYFEIDSLPIDTYTVLADLAGYAGDPVSVTLTNQNPTANNVQVLVGTTTVGVNNTNIVKGVAIFPNPTNASTSLQLESTATGSGVINIVNILGQVVYSTKLNLQIGKNRFELNTANLAKGLYHITLSVGSKYISSQKLIKY